ncbi:MAG: MBL fold metallo-hydrolase [Nitrospinota bacterium]
MADKPVLIKKGIVMFEGNPMIPSNLLLEPIISNSYLLESENEAVLFDPSSGEDIGNRIETYIREMINTKPRLKRAAVVAGHSHFDHSGNFYLSDVFKAETSQAYVHESGFYDGHVLNDPATFIQTKIKECEGHYNFYLSFFFPYNLLTYPVAALGALFPCFASRLFSFFTAMPFPAPRNGSVTPKQLKECEREIINIGGVKVNGWKLGDKVVFSTPGHSPCSVSLFWPEKKALFVSDATWPGNPVFMDASLKECVSSLTTLRELMNTGMVELLLSAHEAVLDQRKSILDTLDFRLHILQAVKQEILSAYRSSGNEKNVRRLTKLLMKSSPLFRMFRQNSYPRFVAFPHSIVALCLKEEGIRG